MGASDLPAPCDDGMKRREQVCMSFLLACPNCGMRRVDEFRFGGEYRVRPEGEVGAREWAAYLYERANIDGEQREWWYHRQGCKQWFIARRDTVTNTVHETAWLSPEKGAQDVQEHDSRSTAASGESNAGLG